jgi:tRNA-uridine 2-sulfurtransferase
LSPETPKAVALLSGGLDSTLAVTLMLEQGFDVLALNFISPFCTCSPRHEGGCHRATQVAQSLGVEIRVFSKGMDYMRLVENPRFGRGRGMNPCLDCRIYTLQKAREIMVETGASFVVTGEVLGQRPMSQHRAALNLVEKESGLQGRLLRPLSAHMLKPTVAEQSGLVDREKLLAIHGRSRKEQLNLAKMHRTEIFSCPAGGCLLTDPVIARRLKDLFLRHPDWNMEDAKLTTFGRHFRVSATLKAVVGRDEAENMRLMHIGGTGPRLELPDHPGPLVLLRGVPTPEDRTNLGKLIRYFAKKVKDETVMLRFQQNGQCEEWSTNLIATEEELDAWRI